MLVNNIDQIRSVLPNLAIEVEFVDFETYILNAENWIQKEIIGSLIYNEIDQGIISDQVLLRFVSNLIVLKAYELGIPYMDLIQTQNGFAVINDKSRAPASKHRVDRLIAQNSLRLNQEIEWLIDYLEDNSIYHDNWKSSASYSILSDCLIQTARQLKRFARFKGDRNEFLFLKPIMIGLTVEKLHPLISKAYLDELLYKLNNGSLSERDSLVLPLIQQSLALYVTNEKALAYQLLSDAVNIMDNDPEGYATYHASSEKALKDSAGFTNAAENSIFVFNG